MVPPFHHIDRLHGLTADPKVLDQLDDGRTNLLFVGRRAPEQGTPLSARRLRRLSRALRTQQPLALGRTPRPLIWPATPICSANKHRGWACSTASCLSTASPTPNLKAYYQRASVFVLASEHEGFCVPVVEAMALQVPIVAYGTTAVPHTVGDAGLVWEEPDPFLLAQSIDAVVRDVDVRRQLTERGWRRYQALFANQRLERDFLHALQSIAA